MVEGEFVDCEIPGLRMGDQLVTKCDTIILLTIDKGRPGIMAMYICLLALMQSQSHKTQSTLCRGRFLSKERHRIFTGQWSSARGVFSVIPKMAHMNQPPFPELTLVRLTASSAPD
jgi:hypothetical protein